MSSLTRPGAASAASPPIDRSMAFGAVRAPSTFQLKDALHECQINQPFVPGPRCRHDARRSPGALQSRRLRRSHVGGSVSDRPDRLLLDHCAGVLRSFQLPGGRRQHGRIAGAWPRADLRHHLRRHRSVDRLRDGAVERRQRHRHAGADRLPAAGDHPARPDDDAVHRSGRRRGQRRARRLYARAAVHRHARHLVDRRRRCLCAVRRPAGVHQHPRSRLLRQRLPGLFPPRGGGQLPGHAQRCDGNGRARCSRLLPAAGRLHRHSRFLLRLAARQHPLRPACLCRRRQSQGRLAGRYSARLDAVQDLRALRRLGVARRLSLRAALQRRRRQCRRRADAVLGGRHRLDPFWQYVAVGAVIIMAVLVDQAKGRFFP
ncbi:MAG: hypothetical protein H6R00_3372 [Proteobacteria bacterium]|nr:hypothetical protein [Pseudomonadota bacterium]